MFKQHLSLLLILMFFIFEERSLSGCVTKLHLLKKKSLAIDLFFTTYINLSLNKMHVLNSINL